MLRKQTELGVRAVVEKALPDDAGDGPAASLALTSLGIDVARWFRPGGRYTPDDIGRLYCRLTSRLIGLPE